MRLALCWSSSLQRQTAVSFTLSWYSGPQLAWAGGYDHQPSNNQPTRHSVNLTDLVGLYTVVVAVSVVVEPRQGWVDGVGGAVAGQAAQRQVVVQE